MLFIIHAVDRTDALPARLENYDAHKAFLSDTSRFGVKIVMSGPLVADDGKTMIGSFFLVEAPSRTEVETFHQSIVPRSGNLEERDDHGLSASAGLGLGLQVANASWLARLIRI